MPSNGTQGLDVVQDIFAIDAPMREWAAEEGIADEEMTERLYDLSDRAMAAQISQSSYTRSDASGGKIGFIANPRPALARAFGDAGTFAPDCRLAWIRATRPAGRV